MFSANLSKSTGTIRNRRIRRVGHDLKAALRALVMSVVPLQWVSDTDVDAIAQLCAMATVPTGDEDPHTILRSISGELLDETLKNFNRVQDSKLLAPVSQFFFVEWCYRNGYLDADWKWQWDSQTEGHVAYKSMRPIESILTGSDA